MPDAIKAYIKALEKEFATGRATEHSHRPAMKALLEEMIPNSQATNEPRRTDCGAPDFVLTHTRNNIPFGYIEAKDINVNLDTPANKKQIKGYYESLDNLIYADYLTFRLIREGKQVAEVCIAEVRGKKITGLPAHYVAFADLIKSFADYDGQLITSADDLAKRMAHKARMLAKLIANALGAHDGESGTGVSEENKDLQGQLDAFRKHLIHDIEPVDFADIYAQTIAYGMFAARLHDPSPKTFTRREAAELIPRTNPFLRKFFQQIAGYDLDDRIIWIVDDLADLFRAADVGELMKDYGKATVRTDPFIHFYETFLGEYDPKKRKSRGVYYTPEPVVDFIVRTVDDILREQLGLDGGIAAKTKTTITVAAAEKEIHKVQILDPATGTGTFLAAIVKHIREKYYADQKGMWPDYVKEHLIPRLNGFEILMASYAMAHIKLDMVLRESGGELISDRLNVFLTNALEDHHPDTDTLFAQWLSNEAEEANRIKRDTPVMVVIGNPPYSGESANKGKWITDLLRNYKQEPGGGKLKEKNSKWLNDDYVKFIRYGQHYIDRTSIGILAFINNHSFLDNPTFRGMRWSLLQSFDAIYILDLHGNAKKKETAPDGSPDKNVFDIQQGVSINLFVKTGNKKKGALARVFHYDLYGERESKYEFLWAKDFKQVNFKELKPQAPQYFFVPKDYELQAEYKKGFSVDDLFEVNGVGIVTAHDDFSINSDKNTLLHTYKKFQSSPRDAELLHNKFNVAKKTGWDILAGWDNLQNEKNIEKYIKPISYRLFDNRFIFYENKLVWRTVKLIMRHFIDGENVGLMFCRQFKASKNYYHAFITDKIFESSLVSNKTSEIGSGFPLYLYPETKQQNLDGQQTREPNLDKTIVQTIAAGLGLTFTPEKETAEKTSDKTFAPIDLLDYIYAVLHSPTYREKYKEFLKIDFPRVPYPTDKNKFRQLVALGGELRTLHLMESKTLNTLITAYNIPGDNGVTKPEFEITDATKRRGKVRINKTQCFENVPETAWNFYIGGYQPAQKWLKDRKGRTLNNDDLEHYQKIIVALFETAKLMVAIDETIGKDGR